MKSLSFLLFFILSSALLSAQIVFEKTYGQVEDEIGYCVQQTSDEGYIICGTTKSYDQYYLNNFYLVKTDKYGIVEWDKVYGPADFQHLFKSIRQTEDGGYIACGYINGPGDGSDFYLVKFTSAGDTSWTKKFNKGANDLAEWIEITSDGGYIICGMAKMASTNADVYLVKTDASGQVTWEKTIDRGKMEHGHCIQQTRDEGYIVCGLQQDPVSNKDDVLLVKINASGDTLWTRLYLADFDQTAFSIRQTDDDGYILCGYTFIDDFDSQVCLMKTNASGIQEWMKTYGGSNFDFGYDLEITEDNGYILTGSECCSGYGYDDLYLIRTETDGDTLWTRHFGGSEPDEGLSVMQTKDLGYIICGRTSSMGEGEDDIYLIKTDANGHTGTTSTNESYAIGFSVYPNPSNGIVEVTNPIEADCIEIWNSKGEQVYSMNVKGTEVSTSHIDLSSFSQGIYIIRMMGQGMSVHQKLMLMK